MRIIYISIFILFFWSKGFSQESIFIYQKILVYLEKDSVFLKFSPQKRSLKNKTFDIHLQPFADSNPFADFAIYIFAKENHISLDSAQKSYLTPTHIKRFRKKFEGYFGKWFNYEVLMYLKKSRNVTSKLLLEFSNPYENYISCSIFLKKNKKLSKNLLVGVFLFHFSKSHFEAVHFIAP